MYVTIVSLRLSELVHAGACEDGVHFFLDLAAMSSPVQQHDPQLVIAWTQLHSVWLAVDYPDFSRWLVNRGLIPGVEAHDADLRGLNMRHAALSRANLTGADLSGSDLSHADLTGADLSGANLSHARLCCSYMRGAKMNEVLAKNVDFTACDMTGVRMHHARVFGGDMRGARLSELDAFNTDLRSMRKDPHWTEYTAGGRWAIDHQNYELDFDGSWVRRRSETTT